MKKKKFCERGHTWYRSSDCPVCPICEKERIPVSEFLSLIPAPARRALEKAGIVTIKKLSAVDEEYLLSLHGFGKSSIPKLKSYLNSFGLVFQNHKNGDFMEERIMTLHPQGKKGVNILLDKYEIIKQFIVKKLIEHGEITFEKLTDLAVEELSSNFDGKVVWYLVTVKLDLEARNIIERIPKTSPHKLRMKK